MTDIFRAELLDYQRLNLDPDRLANTTGFVPPKKKTKTRTVFAEPTQAISASLAQFDDSKVIIKKPAAPTPDRAPEYFWTLTQHDSSDTKNTFSHKKQVQLDALAETAPLSEETPIRQRTKRPAKKPLVPWIKLESLLQSILSTDASSHRLDTNKLVNQVAQGQWPNKIPVKKKARWAAEFLVLVHLPERLLPLSDDIHAVLDKLEKIRGSQGLTIQFIQDYPGGQVLEKRHCANVNRSLDSAWHSLPWMMPESGTPVLIISDLGLYSVEKSGYEHWLSFGRRLSSAGLKPWVLAPVKKSWLPIELTSLYQCLSWDSGSRLRPVQGEKEFEPIWTELEKARQTLGYQQRLKECQAEQQSKFSEQQTKQPCCQSVIDSSNNKYAGCPHTQARVEYLIWLSAAVDMDSHTLRAVRLALGSPLSVAEEVLLWNSGLTVCTHNLCFFHREELEYLRTCLVKLIEQKPMQAKELFNQFRLSLSTRLSIDYFEALQFFKHSSKLSAEEQAFIQKGEQYVDHFIQALSVSPEGARHKDFKGIHRYSQRILNRLGEDTRAVDPKYSYWWGLWLKHQQEKGLDKDLDWPQWLDQAVVHFALGNKGKDYKVEIAIVGNNLILSVNGAYQAQQAMGLDHQWVPISKTDSHTDQVICNLINGDETETSTFYLASGSVIQLPLNRFKAQEYELYIGKDKYRFSSFSKPSWAVSIQQKNSHITAELILNGVSQIAALKGNIFVGGKNRANWIFTDIERKPDKPVISYDKFGLYADLNFLGITQRFRWIEPGTFLMGSPENESERGGNEAQHSVTLTQGYWLADTCVTQALWQAVMGDNPSKFKGEQNPVDSVSWQDCWQFMLKLKERYPNLRLTLPSEAQWEYACRAGTTTPFSFGDQINSKQVSFDGNYPYNDGAKSEYRRQTVPVKSLPINPWGLYEMHGNLLEWCQDKDLREYPSGKAITDPGQQWLESPEGEKRATRPLRGGSWFSRGQDCRSAHRGRDQAAERDHRIGFRLSLGPELQQGGAAATGPQAEVQAGERSGAAKQTETKRSGQKFLQDSIPDSIRDIFNRPGKKS